MKLHTFPPAPNPRKLNTYLGEKGLEIPTRWVNLVKGEHKSQDFLAMNPMASVPVLELDDGTFLTESLVIIEYLEELHPDPPLIGTTPLERARVRRLERLADLGVLSRIARWVHSNKSPLPGVESNPAVVALMEKELARPLSVLDAEVGERLFVAGARPSIADCTLFGAFEFGRFGSFELDPKYENLHRWWAAFSQRPSAQIAPPS